MPGPSHDALLARATRLAAAWGPLAEPPQLLSNRENAVFRLTLAEGGQAALRLHRPGYQSPAAIEAELDWTLRLAMGGLNVPRPWRAGDGSFVVRDGDGLASLVSWVEGAPMGRADQPLSGDRGSRAAVFLRLGRLLGRLHQDTDAITFAAPPDRPHWDLDGLLGSDPRWGRFWEHPALSSTDRQMMAAARDAARTALSDWQTRAPLGDYGLIHADLMRENVLVCGDELALIDFDDSGYGFRAYDLGTAMLQNLLEPDLGDLSEALLAGYAQTRPAAAYGQAELTFFTMLRCFASCGWIVTRMSADSPAQGFYAERALRMARAFLSGQTELAKIWA